MAQWFSSQQAPGVELRSQGDPVYYVGNPDGISRESQGDLVETINSLNTQLSSRQHDPEIATRIAQYELAYEMQASVPELTDFQENPKTCSNSTAVSRAMDLTLPIASWPTTGRTWRSLHSTLPSRMGSPRKSKEFHYRIRTGR